MKIYLIDLMSDEVTRKLQRKIFNRGETILFAENENNYVYFLLEGKAEAYIPNAEGFFSNIHIYESGSFFGELEQFYEGKKPVEISAISLCTVDRLHRDDFFEWMKKDFEVTKFIIKEMGYKLIFNSEYIEEISTLTVKERLMRCIALHRYRGDLDKLTKEQLSKEAKAPIRSINRAIAECSNEGILRYQNKRIKILNPEKIEELLR